MAKYIGKRFIQMILILLAASVLIFCMVRIAPSDPIASMTKGKKISDETRQALIQQYHLDKSLPEQYVIWITGVVHGDFGDSFDYKQPVSDLIGARLPTTLQIVLMSAVLALLIAIPIGIICAVKMNTWLDRLLSILTLILVASPVFLTAIVLFFIIKSFNNFDRLKKKEEAEEEAPAEPEPSDEAKLLTEIRDLLKK